MSKGIRRITYGPRQKSASEALGRIVMAQENEIEPSVEQIEEIPGEEQSAIDTELRAKIEQKRAERAEEVREATNKSVADQFQKLDTRVTIGEVANFDRTKNSRVQKEINAPKAGTKESVIADRTVKWTHFVLDDFNPLLLKATQSWCNIPDYWLDNRILQAIDPATNKALIFWEPTLRTRLELSEKKAKTLAKAAAEFSVSPMGVAVVTWVETHQFMIAVGSALFVAAQYGWTLMQTKAEVAQVKNIVEQQQQAQLQHMATQENVSNGSARYPGFNESVNEYDGGTNP